MHPSPSPPIRMMLTPHAALELGNEMPTQTQATASMPQSQEVDGLLLHLESEECSAESVRPGQSDRSSCHRHHLRRWWIVAVVVSGSWNWMWKSKKERKEVRRYSYLQLKLSSITIQKNTP